MNRKIEIMCIGAAKSGTTSLHDILKNHPQLELPYVKELDYFVNDQAFKNPANLRKHYRFLDHTVAMGITPSIMASPVGLRRVYDYNPSMKIIIMLRNPTERFVSLYKMRERNLKETRTFKELVLDELESYNDLNHRSNSHFHRALYSERIKQVQDIFPKDQIYYLLFEDFIKNQEESVNRMLTWCGLSKFNFEPVKSNAAINAKKNFVWSLYRLIPRHLVVFLSSIMSSSLKQKFRKIFEKKAEPLNIDPESLALLRQAFEESIVEVEGLTGLNCEVWRS